jgi:hypothetical protein
MDNLQMSLGVIITLVIVALLFDFMNGFHVRPIQLPRSFLPAY